MAGAHVWVGGYRLPFATLAAVAGCAALAVVVGARTAALVHAVVLGAAAAVRAVTRRPGPGIAIRSRWFDVVFLGVLAVFIGLVALTTTGV